MIFSFSPYSRSYSVHFSFSTFSVFLAIFQVIQCLCIIIHVFQFSCHIPGPTVLISHFASFWVFLALFHVLQCVFLFSMNSVFSLNPGPNYCISHFSRFPVFLSIFHVLQCAFLISQIFECLLPYSRSYSVHFSFPPFSMFFAILHVIQWFCLIFHVFQIFRHNIGPPLCISLFQVFECFSP